jgi:hemolysin activation/secretion protein
LYRGIDALGATDPLEEDGLGFISKPDFLAYRGALTYHRRLWYDTFGLARIVAQASGDSLPASERMRMGGAYSVRGYSENEYSADYGMYANFEFYLPFDKPWAMIPKGWRLPHSKEPLAKELQWVLFLDMGHGGINDAFIGEDASRDFMGAGIGLRWKIYDKTYLRMDLAAARHSNREVDLRIRIKRFLDFVFRPVGGGQCFTNSFTFVALFQGFFYERLEFVGHMVKG